MPAKPLHLHESLVLHTDILVKYELHKPLIQDFPGGSSCSQIGRPSIHSMTTHLASDHPGKYRSKEDRTSANRNGVELDVIEMSKDFRPVHHHSQKFQ